MITFKKNIETDLIEKWEGNIFLGRFAELNTPILSEEYASWVSNGNTPEEIGDIAIKLQKTKTSKISQCKSYLSSTDWYAIRKADNGTAIPTEIQTNRELARTLQDDINACTTIEELNAINIEL